MKKVLFTLLFISQSLVGIAQQYAINHNYEEDFLKFDLINLRETPLWWEIKALDSLKIEAQFIEYGKLLPKDTIHSFASIPLQNVKDSTDVDISSFLDFDLIIADPRATHDYSYSYKIPFGKESKFEVIQTFKQSFSHFKPTSLYAVDFALPIHTPITAARGGVIIGIEDSFKEAGGRELFDKANYINILHDDGTFGQYLHLDHNGVLVKLNESIIAGQIIGYSGHTGFSTRPHLHFVVKNGLGISQEFQFKGYKKWLKTGRKYRGQGSPNLD